MRTNKLSHSPHSFLNAANNLEWASCKSTAGFTLASYICEMKFVPVGASTVTLQDHVPFIASVDRKDHTLLETLPEVRDDFRLAGKGRRIHGTKTTTTVVCLYSVLVCHSRAPT